MACFHPLTAYWSKEIGVSGKRGITFSRDASFSGVALKLPCNQCIGCRLERSRQWAVRCMHEKQLHTESSFLTLTYSDEYLPAGGTLVKRDLQLFMKRMRRSLGDGIRFYACGEYGTVTKRPHYHVLLFNRDFADKRFYKMAESGQHLYTSELVRKLWFAGHNVIGDVTFDSCAYVARYIAEKITGDRAAAHYNGRTPEFTCMSKRPGIGDGWFKRFGEGAYDHDSVVMNGREIRPPRFYDTRYELVDSVYLSELKLKRRREAMKHRADNTPERRRVRERVAILSLQKKEQL